MSKKTLFIGLIFLCVTLSCKKQDCKECTKTICGIASCDEFETIKSCSQTEIDSLENSSSGNVYWTCE